MSKKTAGLARTNIKKSFEYLQSFSPNVLTYSLSRIGISKTIVELLKGFGVKKLSDLNAWLNEKEFIYELEKNNKAMTKLSREIASYRKKIEKKLTRKQEKDKKVSKTSEAVKSTKNPKIKAIHINSIKKITNSLEPLVNADKNLFLNKTLREVGASPYCYNYAYKKNIKTLKDVYDNLNNLIQIYNYV